MLMETPGCGHNSEMALGNWIAVDRDLRYHEVIGFLNEDGSVRKGVVVCQTMAWIDLIMEANWKDRKENNKGRVILVERGQLIAARAWLAKRWGWTQDKVRYFLQRLESNGLISRSDPRNHTQSSQNRTHSNTQKRAHYANVLTICKYDIYQTVHELDDLLYTQSNTQQPPKSHPHQNKGTREQESPVPIGTDGDPPSEKRKSFKGQLWDVVLSELKEHTGKDTQQVRTLVGKWNRDYGLSNTLEAMAEASVHEPADRVSWITAWLKQRAGKGLTKYEQAAMNEADENRKALEALKNKKEQANG